MEPRRLPTDAAATGAGASGYYHHGGSLPLPLPARHERGEGWGEGHVPSNWLIGIPSPLPSPHSCVVGRGNRPAAWWWFELPSTGPRRS